MNFDFEVAPMGFETFYISKTKLLIFDFEVAPMGFETHTGLSGGSLRYYFEVAPMGFETKFEFVVFYSSFEF